VTDKVDVRLGWAEVSASEDPQEYIRQAALGEIQLMRRYEEGEMVAVEKDDDGVLRDSCRNAYLWMRGKVERREKANVRAKKKGTPEDPSPLAWKVPVAYSRPATRTWMNRPRKPE